MSSGLNLPLGSTLTVGYDEGKTRGLADRGGNQTTESRTWPDLSWRWSRIPMPSFLNGIVAGANLTAGFRETERDNRFGGTSQARFSEDRSVPLRLSVTLLNGMALTYSGNLGEGASRDPTGETQRQSRRHDVELRGSFDAPSGWETFSQPIHTSLSYGRDAQFTCRTRFAGQTTPGEDPCTATSDFVTQTLSMQLDTILRRINVGANLSYTDRQSATGLREGNRQILLTLFGQFDFQFGQMPGALGAIR